MGEWKEAIIEKKDAEPNYFNIGFKLDGTKVCWGVGEKKGVCKNIVKWPRAYCNSCREYFDSGEWMEKYGTD